MKRKILIFTAIFSLAGNAFGSPDPENPYQDHIVVASSANQAVSLLRPDGSFLRELRAYDGSTTDFPTGVAAYDANSVLVAVDGIDRVERIQLGTGERSSFILDSNLMGAIGGITRLQNGDVLVVETNNIERFNSGGARLYPPMPIFTGGNGIDALPGGAFVHCSDVTDRVGVFDDRGNLLASAASGYAGTSDAADCAAQRSGSGAGRIAVAWSGIRDTIAIFEDATLTRLRCTYANEWLLSNPSAVAFRPNGNVLAADELSNVVIEFDDSCRFVRTLSSVAFAGVTDLQVIH